MRITKLLILSYIEYWILIQNTDTVLYWGKLTIANMGYYKVAFNLLNVQKVPVEFQVAALQMSRR